MDSKFVENPWDVEYVRALDYDLQNPWNWFSTGH